MKNVIILGAEGRNIHNFNVYFKNNPDYKVVAFTSDKVLLPENREYPVQLSGRKYPYGIPIIPENDLAYQIKRYNVEECIFCYNVFSYDKMKSLASTVLAAGAGFHILSPKKTMLHSLKPIIAICSAPSECGKGQATLKAVKYLQKKGKKVFIIRYPMPTGVLKDQIVQRFAVLEDLVKHKCTVEEIEQTEVYLKNGNIVYSGVDFHDILRAVDDDINRCDIILWDGGNYDTPFYKPDLMMTQVDTQQIGEEKEIFPNELNIKLSDVILVNKTDFTDGKNVINLKKNITEINPKAQIIEAASPIELDDPDIIKNKKVLIIEDQQALKLPFRAGELAAQKYGVSEIINPEPYAVGSIKEIFENQDKKECSSIITGYNEQHYKDLEESIQNTPCDAVILATPYDLSKVITIKKPIARVHYSLYDYGATNLSTVLDDFIEKHFEN